MAVFVVFCFGTFWALNGKKRLFRHFVKHSYFMTMLSYLFGYPMAIFEPRILQIVY